MSTATRKPQGSNMRHSPLLAWLISYGLLSIIVFGFIMRIHISPSNKFVKPHPLFPYNYKDEEPLDEDQTCQFPNLDPYDRSLHGYVWEAPPIRCKGRQYILTYLDETGRLKLNLTALNESNYRWSSLTCKYQQVSRRHNDDFNLVFGEERLFDGRPTVIHFEYVKVWCTNFAGFNIYDNFHAQVIVKDSVVKRNVDDKTKTSVFIFVIDSLSRLQGIRQLPKTYHFLTHNMGSVIMRGTTVVGDNTFPNIVPILTGWHVYSYPEFNNASESPANFHTPESYDDWPLIWKDFSKKGYATMLVEDCASVNVFTHLAQGFQSQPTSHYPRPFWLALETSTAQRLSSIYCLGPTPKHKIFINYVREFILKYRKRPYFALSILTEVNHNVANQVGAIDDDLVEFLREIYENGHLDNTIFVLMGDHGQRIDTLANTNIGSVEKRMPFMSIYVPPWFKTKFPVAFLNLKTNSKRLTSVFDLHVTLKQILSGDIQNNSTKQQGVGKTSFFQHISPYRTCHDALVPSQLCVCDEEVPIEIDEENVIRAASKMVRDINFIISPFSEFCVALKLESIERAFLKINKRITNSKVSISTLLKTGHDAWIRIAIKVSPSNAIFEGVVEELTDGTMKVINTISRINRYGNQSSCLTQSILHQNPNLPLYCYCKV